MTSEATSTTLEELLFLTKVYEEAELFEDMIACMKKYTTLKTDLNAEERDLLSRAYKNHSASKRTAWRVLNSLEKQSDVKDTNNITLIKQFKSKIEKELDDICNDALDLAETLLNTKDIVYSETRVHLLKMKADYYRYMAEYKTGEDYEKACEGAFECYQKANEVAGKELGATSPVRLGLVLNYSMFLNDIFNEKHNAIKLAKSAFNEAIENLEDLSEEDYKDTVMVISLMRDFFNFWISELENDLSRR